MIKVLRGIGRDATRFITGFDRCKFGPAVGGTKTGGADIMGVDSRELALKGFDPRGLGPKVFMICNVGPTSFELKTSELVGFMIMNFFNIQKNI